MVRDGVTYRLVLDRRGSVRRVVDVATGAVAQALDYDAYGRVVRDTAPGFQPFGFGGGLYDPRPGSSGSARATTTPTPAAGPRPTRSASAAATRTSTRTSAATRSTPSTRSACSA